MSTRDPHIYQMAYNAECDGYDREWHRSYAKNRSQLDDLTRGANQAKLDVVAMEEAHVTPERFKPKKL